MSYTIQKKTEKELNRIYEYDLPVHDWYRFVLSFPPHLVRNYIKEFKLNADSCLFDPFCGTGTTLVEAKKLGIKSIGFEANPVVHMCASTKVNWSLPCDIVLHEARQIAKKAQYEIDNSSQDLTLDQEKLKLLIKNSISPIPLHKTLNLIRAIESYDSKYNDFYKTALAKEAVVSYSNLKFSPEVGVCKKKVLDVDVVNLWLNQIEKMLEDLNDNKCNKDISSYVFLADSRLDLNKIPDNSIDAVITSPPYPNEKDYSRTTRLESVLLNFIKDKDDLRTIKKSLLRSNSKGVYKGDDDYIWIADNITVNNLANTIETTRIKLGKTSGFEKLYHKVVRLYFGGMARHLYNLRPKLKDGAKLAYVVGDQYSYFKTPIKTGNILAEIAQNLGYAVIKKDLFRKRMSTVTKDNINEEVLVLEYRK